MSIVSPMTIALLIALILGTASSAWLWLVHNRTLITTIGLRALAAMRWRESSRFVIEALEDQGFSASRLSPDARRGQNADLVLDHGDQTWLLTFKQGVDYRVDSSMVNQMAAAVRDSSASGGIIATLGTIQGDARKHSQGIDLIDGATLWPLISPLLPPSLQNDVTAAARRRTVRATTVAWLIALVLGFAASRLIPAEVADPARDAATTPAGASASRDTPTDTAKADQPAMPAIAASEEEQRHDVVRAVAALPGIIRASWATRSTLVALVDADVSEQQTDGICDVLAPYDDLRYSRVQLQPPPESEAPVRFLQCSWN